MRQPIQVLVYLYRHSLDGHEYLMLHRCPDNYEFWQGVSGGVETEETPFEAAIREVGEETGLAGIDLRDIGYSFSFPLEDYWRGMFAPGVKTIVAHTFVAEVPPDASIVLSPLEHSEYRWTTFDGAMELLYWPDNKEALRKAEEFIRMQVR
jgi:dATP pyrophosphohydrolase